MRMEFREMIRLPQSHTLCPGSYTCYPPNMTIHSLCHATCWLGKGMHQGGPALGRARCHLHRSSLTIVTHLCLRNINHHLAAPQVNVRGNKGLSPLISHSCLDCKTQPYGETHRSLTNRFPQQPHQSGQAPRSPGWEGPFCWLPVPSLTRQRRPPSPPV